MDGASLRQLETAIDEAMWEAINANGAEPPEDLVIAAERIALQAVRQLEAMVEHRGCRGDWRRRDRVARVRDTYAAIKGLDELIAAASRRAQLDVDGHVVPGELQDAIERHAANLANWSWLLAADLD